HIRKRLSIIFYTYLRVSFRVLVKLCEICLLLPMPEIKTENNQLRIFADFSSPKMTTMNVNAR
ncbi:MAG: hypothetical protein ACKOPK_06125, partial [Dolichospermum sp.]